MEALAARLEALEKENAELKQRSLEKTIFVKKNEKFPIFKLDAKFLTAREWHVEASDFLETCDMSEYDKVAFLKEHISGDAYIDIVNRLSRDELKKSDSILGAFKELFCSASELGELIKKLWCSRQVSGESLSQFARGILTTNRRIGNIDLSQKMNEENLKTIFLKGVRSDELRRLLTTMNRDNSVTFESMKEFAVNLETDCREEMYEAKVESHIVQNGLSATVSALQENVSKLSMKVEELLSERNSRPVKNTLKCYVCNRPGHISRDCWFRESNFFPGQNSVEKRQWREPNNSKTQDGSFTYGRSKNSGRVEGLSI